MSCSVVAIPFALAQIVVSVAGIAIDGYCKQKAEKESAEIADYANDLSSRYNEEVVHIQTSDIIEKEFETAYIDKEILMKTLEEHGLSNIEEDYSGKITGSVDNFMLTFEKPSSDKPYNLKISCRKCDNAEEKLDDLNSEYALNVQEDAYLHIINKLKDNNIKVEEEVVEEDNTIVLTINLE